MASGPSTAVTLPSRNACIRASDSRIQTSRITAGVVERLSSKRSASTARSLSVSCRASFAMIAGSIVAIVDDRVGECKRHPRTSLLTERPGSGAGRVTINEARVLARGLPRRARDRSRRPNQTPPLSPSPSSRLFVFSFPIPLVSPSATEISGISGLPQQAIGRTLLRKFSLPRQAKECPRGSTAYPLHRRRDEFLHFAVCERSRRSAALSHRTPREGILCLTVSARSRRSAARSRRRPNEIYQNLTPSALDPWASGLELRWEWRHPPVSATMSVYERSVCLSLENERPRCGTPGKAFDRQGDWRETCSARGVTGSAVRPTSAIRRCHHRFVRQLPSRIEPRASRATLEPPP